MHLLSLQDTVWESMFCQAEYFGCEGITDLVDFTGVNTVKVTAVP